MKKLLVVSCVSDDKRAPISMYLLKNELTDVKAGVAIKAEELDAEVLYLLPTGETVEGLDDKISYTTPSPVLKNPYAVAQVLSGNIPRPMIQDDFAAVFEDKEIAVISPEDAYNLKNGTGIKFIAVNVLENCEIKKAAVGDTLSSVADFADAKAVLVGGLKGQFYLPGEAAALKVTSDFHSDSITIYDNNTCIVATAAALMAEAQAASCGKCVLCREGTAQYRQIIAEMTTGKAKSGDMALVKEVGELIEIGAYCPFGQNMPRTIISAMELFAGEFNDHVKKKECKCGLCYKADELYYIDPDECTGCGECIDACEEEAIEGRDGYIHIIDQDLCEHCGKCAAACEEGCIKTAAKLPKLPKKRTKVGKW